MTDIRGLVILVLVVLSPAGCSPTPLTTPKNLRMDILSSTRTFMSGVNTPLRNNFHTSSCFSWLLGGVPTQEVVKIPRVVEYAEGKKSSEVAESTVAVKRARVAEFL